MRLSIDIREDAELRKHITEMIEGRIRGIARSEIERVVLEETRRILSGNVSGLTDIVEKCARQEVKSMMSISEMIDKHVRAYVEKNAPPLLKELLPKAVDVGVDQVINRLTRYRDGGEAK